MPFQNRQVNPILQALMQRMGQMGPTGGQQPGMGQPGQGPPVAQPMMMLQGGMGKSQPGLLNQSQQPAPQQNVSSIGGMDPSMIAMLMQKMKGMNQPQPGESNPAGYEQLMSQFAGGMPKPDFSKYQLPPSFNWMPTGNG